MIFASTSQAGQDEWVRSKLPEPGLYLDVGCGHPFNGSNTAGLERIGWSGFLVDLEPGNVEACKRERPNSRAIRADAATIHWTACLSTNRFDYVSLDVDEAQVAALKNLLAHHVTFKVATVEHDSYRFGPGPRAEIRELLWDAGYVLARADVECDGNAFEDWWLDPRRVAA